ncbi:hypothetical protein [Lentzea kentuckyensis]|uniref:hypothetical protein n=1 Tax=Lentzea kentuckyensis TaxID=360086 RepID=UPI00117A9A28|nr:hypothetical protein [Lentzea kentuckyensis]
MKRFEIPDPVMTLDLRSTEGQVYAENLRRRDASELGPSSRVLVVDTTTGLSAHHDWFARLARLPQVTSVVLVAVGTLETAGSGPMLRTPSAFTGVGVTLWVGDGPGVPWEGGSQRPGAGAGTAGLDDLLTALRFPSVFDRVFEAIGEMPHQAANPGLAVDYATVEPAMMRALRLRALRQLVATGVSARQHDRESAELTSVVRSATGDETATLKPGSPLSEATTLARDRLAKAQRAVTALRGWTGLLGTRQAHRVVLSRLAEAGEAVTRHQQVARRALEDADASLAEGYPPPTDLVEQGLPSPAPVNSVELAESLRKAITTELAGGRTLPGLADQARGFGNQLGAARSLAVVGGHTDAEVWTLAPPPMRLWPTPVAGLLPVVLLTCLVAAWLPGMDWWPAAGLGLVWLLLLGLVTSRAPAGAGPSAATGRAPGRHEASSPRTATSGFVPRVQGRRAAGRQPAWLLLAATAGAAAVGTVAGGVVPGVEVGRPVAGGVLGLLVVVAVAGTVIGWNRAVDAWTAAIPLRRTAAAHQRLADQVTRLIEHRWTPADRTRRLADALLVVAGGIDAVAEVFADVIKNRPDDDGGQSVSGDSSEGLAEVLHRDLVAITLEVLRPSFDEIASRMPLSGDTHRSLLRAQELVSDYNDHLEHVGLRELPPFVTDDGPRRRLAATLWQSSAASRRVLLLTERSRMTQLCAAEDVRRLQADGAVVVHFASSDMDLPPTDGAEVIRTRGDAVGAIRLTPLLRRYVEREVHTAEHPAETEEGDVP